MSGHSKWSNIKRKKEKTDSGRAKIFTKIGRELAVAVRDGGGPDVNTNSKLREVINKAKQNNVPNENIERIIKKAAGDGDTNKFQNISYEGYGPSGSAFIVETLTDNKNRTAGNLRHYFDKYGGNLGTNGCVSFLFKKRGIIIIEKRDLDEEIVTEEAINLGVSDFKVDDEVFYFEVDPENFEEVKNGLSKKYEILNSELAMVAENSISIESEEDLKKFDSLVEALEDDDDVQNVWNNVQE